MSTDVLILDEQTAISEADARSIAKHSAGVSLGGLTEISAVVAECLAACGGPLFLGSSPETVGKPGRLKATLGLSKRGEGPSMGRPVSGVP